MDYCKKCDCHICSQQNRCPENTCAGCVEGSNRRKPCAYYSSFPFLINLTIASDVQEKPPQ